MRARVGFVLTLISLRMTSIMLPITMRKSKTFHGSLKYPYTGWVKGEEEGKRGRLAGKQHLRLLGRPIKVEWGWAQWRNTQMMTHHMKEFKANEHLLLPQYLFIKCNRVSCSVKDGVSDSSYLSLTSAHRAIQQCGSNCTETQLCLLKIVGHLSSGVYF